MALFIMQCPFAEKTQLFLKPSTTMSCSLGRFSFLIAIQGVFL